MAELNLSTKSSALKCVWRISILTSKNRWEYLKVSAGKYETDHKVLAFVVGFKERIKLNRSFVRHVQSHLSLHLQIHR